MTNDPDVLLRRARIVIDSLGARVGALTAENLELLARIRELELVELERSTAEVQS